MGRFVLFPAVSTRKLPNGMRGKNCFMVLFLLVSVSVTDFQIESGGQDYCAQMAQVLHHPTPGCSNADRSRRLFSRFVRVQPSNVLAAEESQEYMSLRTGLRSSFRFGIYGMRLRCCPLGTITTIV
jgi:hypothetical protein